MKITIISKIYGRQTIDTENGADFSTGSVIFKIIEHIWNDWYDHALEHNSEYRAMYFGDGDEPACYTKKGAIQGGIETLIEIAEESKKQYVTYTTKDIMKMDIESAFE